MFLKFYSTIIIILFQFILIFPLNSLAQQQEVFRKVSTGTGFFINRKGYIVTNAHVLDNCSYINILGGVELSEAVEVARDDSKDLAVLKTRAKPDSVAPLRYNQSLKRGDDVMVIGYPEKHSIDRIYKTEIAEILETAGPNGEKEWLQFSSVTKKGNSGGPLLDLQGNVIGVVTAKLTRYTQSGIALDNADLAVNMPILKKFLDANFINYDQIFTFQPLSEKRLTKDAEKFIVSIHCIK